MENQIVVFELGTEHFGLNIASVESIIKMQSIRKLPQAPGYLEGITNLRDQVLPVIDLHTRLCLPAQATDKDSRIIVVNLAGTKVGMIVDGVSEVLTVSDHTVEPPPTIAATIKTDFITGIARIDQHLVILLDLNCILKSEEQAELQKLTI
jgi:purine-binding chemotaxis protein CheW